MRRYIILYYIIFLVFFNAIFAYGQKHNSCDATFQILANTNALKTGQSIVLACQIKNLSTNISFRVEAYPLENAPVILTDGAGKTYIPIDLHSPSWDQTFYFPSSYDLGPSNSCQWTLSFTIDKSIPRGNYKVTAGRTIYFGDANFFAKFLTPTNQPSKSCKLESNSLGIKIQ